MASSGTRPSAKRADKRIASWELARIAEATAGQLVDTAAAGVRPTAVSTDTRAIGPGELFVALRGENFDAHDFIDQAEEAGAVAAIVDRAEDLDTDLALIVVDDTLAALTALGRAIWREATAAGLHTINVTGSNGKTTVKEMLASLWQAHGEVFATPGNLNNHIGVPLVLCAIPEGCEHLVLEMGANAAGEISHLVGLAPGTERIITSIGVAHVEGFGSVDGIRRAKSEIFEGADAHTTAIVPHAERDNLVAADFPGAVITVGVEADADLRVESIEEQVADSGERSGYRSGQRVRIARGEEAWEVDLSLPGVHNGLNAAVSLATLLARGLEPNSAECSARLSTLSLPQGRWREVEVDGLR
ncbi:MAG: UDP-N-acetylmuramoyl-tripeptide--D-alanyl-D-alanine ligase, partial [Persicimonas sp.]